MPKSHADDAAGAAEAVRGAELDPPSPGYVLLCTATEPVRDLLGVAAVAEQFESRWASDDVELSSWYRQRQPSLVVIEHAPPDVYADDAQALVAKLDLDSQIRTPTLLIVQPEAVQLIDADVFSEVLTVPLSSEYAGARMREWVDRTPVLWRRAELPVNEAARLEQLQTLCVLDTDPEPRFDRVVQIAADAFDVPIALVSLVDRERQWFKARHGLAVGETHRDMAFCAHVVHSAEPVIVPDTLLDPRFAEHPLVRGAPGIRFYAGVPLMVDGHCVGTLCLIDTRPRDADFGNMALLEDLRDMVVTELQQPGS